MALEEERLEVAETIRRELGQANALTSAQARAFVRCLQHSWLSAADLLVRPSIARTADRRTAASPRRGNLSRDRRRCVSCCRRVLSPRGRAVRVAGARRRPSQDGRAYRAPVRRRLSVGGAACDGCEHPSPEHHAQADRGPRLRPSRKSPRAGDRWRRREPVRRSWCCTAISRP